MQEGCTSKVFEIIALIPNQIINIYLIAKRNLINNILLSYTVE